MTLRSRTDLAVRFPRGAAVRLDSLAENPYPVFHQLREHEPVTWVPEVEMWFVTRRDDVAAVLADFETFTVDTPHSVIRDMFGRHMMTTDGDEQVQLKRMCMPPFRPKALLENTAREVRRETDVLIDRLANQETTELRLGLAKPLAIHTVITLLGIPSSATTRIREWYEHFARALANFVGDPEVRDRGKQAANEFGAYCVVLLDQYRRSPQACLLSDLACSPNGLTDQEIVSNALIILFGGIETTEAMICNTVWALLTHPRQLAAVRHDRALIRPAVEEALRWEAAVQSCTRHVTRNTVLRGVDLRVGDVVQCMLGAANRDPEHFEDPDQFDIRRPNARDHLSFGAGRHFCLGAPLAMLETETVVQTLIDRFPMLELDPTRPATPRGYEFRKPPELWVRMGRTGGRVDRR